MSIVELVAFGVVFVVAPLWMLVELLGWQAGPQAGEDP